MGINQYIEFRIKYSWLKNHEILAYIQITRFSQISKKLILFIVSIPWICHRGERKLYINLSAHFISTKLAVVFLII